MIRAALGNLFLRNSDRRARGEEESAPVLEHSAGMA